MLPIEPGCLAVIVATTPSCGYMPDTSAPKGHAGKIVEVVSLSTDRGCSCCVSVLPTWAECNDKRGLVCRRSNLLRIDGYIETEELAQEVEA